MAQRLKSLEGKIERSKKIQFYYSSFTIFNTAVYILWSFDFSVG